MDSSKRNRFRTDLWKMDSMMSVDYYNEWFMRSAPDAYKTARKGVVNHVKRTMTDFGYLSEILGQNIVRHPDALSVLRACTAPPLAKDRLAGLSGTTRTLIETLEDGRLPSRISEGKLLNDLSKMAAILSKLIDYDIFPWLGNNTTPSAQAVSRSASIVADRISGSLADPIIRNSQESRQLAAIDSYLSSKGYRKLTSSEIESIASLPTGTFAHHVNVSVELRGGKTIRMPLDVVIQPKSASIDELPLLIECKSAGDFANTNKRRKEEAHKVSQLRDMYGDDSIVFILFLCGYFDVGYLGYEASENIDWVWEHRITDFEEFGV